jgi:hypothetical protein
MKNGLILIALGIIMTLTIPSPILTTGGKQIEEEQTKKHSITKEEIVHLTDEFMNILVQQTNPDYQVKEYKNKASLLHRFMDVSTEAVAKEYLDYYYYEDNGKLYIVPTETPPWFVKQNDYDVVQLEYNKVLVKQDNHSELYGEYRIDIEFTFKDQEWKITKITHH